ncbi:TPA: hypothetical protein N0F65_008707 [Lagenidium giganteum]|uniref:Sec20 C-terminal domain-containing protein n=1 Tax=Lagenidium giganteum TaxID=4803 RepID=A0AAV2YS45_9STRA|nr:TPA: hypothetical protein N0F65_008707 [Lagenidium giganteum]
MNVLEQSERELGSYLRHLARCADAQNENHQLTYAEEEEEAMEAKLTELFRACTNAVSAAEEWVLEVSDSTARADHEKKLAQVRDALAAHAVTKRKFMVTYQQRAKKARLENARASLMSKSAAAERDSASKVSSGSAVDVTATMRRTRHAMSREIQRVSSVTKILDDGRQSLRSTHDEYGSVQAEIAEVRKRLVQLQWQARQDRMWIAAGMAILAWTVLHIVHQRTGLPFLSSILDGYY